MVTAKVFEIGGADVYAGQVALAAIAIASVGFVVLLCVPGMPAFMALPSWLALVAWVLLGATCYVARAGAYRALPARELDRRILRGRYTSEG